LSPYNCIAPLPDGLRTDKEPKECNLIAVLFKVDETAETKNLNTEASLQGI